MKTIKEIKAANLAAWENWFSKETLSFRQCVVYDNVYEWNLFITSDVMDERRRSVRKANDNWLIDTVSELWQFASFEDAEERIKNNDK